MTLGTLFQVTDELVKRGLKATLEYPGYIQIIADDMMCNAGDAHATIGVDFCWPDGQLNAYSTSSIPSDSTDVQAIANFIALEVKHA